MKESMSSTGRQRRGLVLSGGGFFGAFNAITRVVWAELLLM